MIREIHTYGTLIFGKPITCKHLNSETKRFYHGVKPSKDANRIASSEDPGQTAPLSDLGCPDLSVQNFWIATVSRGTSCICLSIDFVSD